MAKQLACADLRPDEAYDFLCYSGGRGGGVAVEFLRDSGRDRTYKTVFSPAEGLVDLTDIHQISRNGLTASMESITEQSRIHSVFMQLGLNKTIQNL